MRRDDGESEIHMAVKDAIVRFTAIDRVSSVVSRMAGNVERGMSRTENAQRRVGAVTERSSAQWEQNGRAMELAGRGFISTGTILSGLLSAGIVTATKTASDMEDAFTGVMKVTDMTDQEYRGLEKTIMQMSTRIPASFEEISGAMEVAGRLGIEGSDNIEKFAETVLMMGVATEMSAEDAADSMARFMNIMGTSQSDVDRLGSVIVELGNNFATTEPEILNMGLRLAGASKQIGLSEAETLGLAAAMSALGLRAEMGGSAMSKFMTKALTEVQQGGEAASKWADIAGVSVSDLSNMMEDDFAGALQLIVKGFGEVSEEGENLDQVLRDMGINDIRMLDTIKRLSSGYGLLEQAISMASSEWETNTALVEEAELRYGTFSSMLRMFINRLRNILKGFGEVFMEVFNEIFQVMAPVLEKVEELTYAFFDLETGAITPLGKAVGILTAALVAMFAALIPIGIVSLLAGQVFFMASAFGVAAINVARVVGVILGAVGAIVTITLTIIMFREEIAELINQITERFPWVEDAFNAVKDAVLDLWEKIKPLVGSFMEFIGTVITVMTFLWGLRQAFSGVMLIVGKVMRVISILWGVLIANPISILVAALVGLIWVFIRLWNENEEFKQSIIDAWESIKATVLPVVEDVVNFISDKWGEFMTWWEENKDRIYDKAEEVWNSLVEFLENVVIAIVGWLIEKWYEFKVWWDENQDEIYAKAEEIWNNLVTFFTETVPLIIATIMEKWEEFKEWWSETQDAVQTKAEEVWQAITDFITPLVEELVDFVTEEWRRLTEWWEEDHETIKQAVDTVWPYIEGVIRIAIMVIGDVIGWFLDNTLGRLIMVWEILSTAVGIAWDIITFAISQAIIIITGIITGLAELITGDFSGAWETLKETVDETWANIWDTIKSITGRITTLIGGWLSDIWSDFQTWWSDIAETVGTFLDMAVVYVITGMLAMYNAAKQKLSEIATEAWNKFTEFAKNVWDGMTEAASNLRDKLVEMKDEAVTKLAELVAEVVSAFVEFASAVWDGMVEAVTNVATGVSDMISEFTSADWFSAGTDIVQGVINGIKSMWSTATGVAKSLGGAIMDGFNKMIGRNSPAKEFIYGGEDIVRGAVLGIDRNAKDAYKSASRMGQTVIDGFGDPSLDVAPPLRNSSADFNRSLSKAVVSARTESSRSDDMTNRQPAHINVTIGGQEFKTFSENIYNANAKRLDFRSNYEV